MHLRGNEVGVRFAFPSVSGRLQVVGPGFLPTPGEERWPRVLVGCCCPTWGTWLPPVARACDQRFEHCAIG